MRKNYISLLMFFLFFIGGKKLAQPYHAIVSAEYSNPSLSKIDGIPAFANIAGALAAVPDNNSEPFIIFIRNGRYYEKLNVDKPHVHFLGENKERTIITFDAAGGTLDPNEKKYGTRGCSTLRITAPGFVAENLTVENGFDYPANEAKTRDDPTRVDSPQAVAIMTDGNNDKAVFRNCQFNGYQDTAFLNAGRNYFYMCKILGHVDFIFGAGQVVFDKCEIVSRTRKDKNPAGYITAPSTSIKYPYGFLFINCRFEKETEELPKGSVRLGRPWHPGNDQHASGSAVFMNCYMDDHIGPEGYAPISSRDSTGTRIWYEIKPDSRFFEYGNYGPGALKSEKRPILDEKSANWYSAAKVLNGWIP
ncbi:MAG: pectinesterase family protein [Ignavibacteria bacterium]|jgi:pectinesterase